MTCSRARLLGAPRARRAEGDGGTVEDHHRRPGVLALTIAACLAAVAAMAATAVTAHAAPLVTGRIVAAPVATGGPAAPSRAELGASTEGAGETVTIDTGSSFDMVGALFRSPPADVRTVRIQLRVSVDRLHWSGWLTLRADVQSGPAGSVQSKHDAVTEPAWVGTARYIQYRVTSSASGPVMVGALRFACVSSRVTGAVALASAPTPPTALGDAPAAPARVGMPAKPAIVSRAQWRADESLRSGDGPYYGTVRCAFVHHTVNANGYSRKQAPALVRGIYYYHTRVNGWSDIGYNFLIDRFGTIYEGRYGGVTRPVIGAQVLGFNSWSTGVSMIGTYSSVTPSAAALSSLEHLLAWKLDLSHLDPQGTARIQCSTSEKYRAGQWVTVPVIVGHRQVNYTECPGNALANLLPAIRAAVAGIGNPKIYSPSASSPAFSPNGDGLLDTDTLRCTLSQTSDWSVTVGDASGSTVRTFSGNGTSVRAVWDGNDEHGVRVPDGAYTATFAASSPDGAARSAATTVVVDTVSPAITGLALTPAIISPNADHIADLAHLSFSLGERCRVHVVALDDAGAVVRTTAWTTLAAGARRLVWDGEVTGTAGLVTAADGAYHVRVVARDSADNRRSLTTSVSVNSTLAKPVARPVWISPNGDGVRDQTTISFTMKRSARVTVDLTGSSGARVRRFSLGTLAAGSHQIVWDGKDSGGSVVPSGAYLGKITAVNTVGTVSVPVSVHVDTVPPVPAWAAATRTISLGKTVHVGFTVTDAFALRAFAVVVVRKPNGDVVTRPTLTVTPGTTRTWSFKPVRRGVYTLTLHATDRAGNRETLASVLKLTVK